MGFQDAQARHPGRDAHTPEINLSAPKRARWSKLIVAVAAVGISLATGGPVTVKNFLQRTGLTFIELKSFQGLTIIEFFTGRVGPALPATLNMGRALAVRSQHP